MSQVTSLRDLRHIFCGTSNIKIIQTWMDAMRRKGNQSCLMKRTTKIRNISAVLSNGLPCVAVLTHSSVQNHPHRGAALTRELLMETL